MAGARDSEDEEEPRDDFAATRLLMIAVLVLAVAATAVLVLSDSAKMLRLGVLAALWAALLGVFLASKFRKAVAEKENEVADLQSVYELELEREVAARREYELEVEAAARKRVDEANREDLTDLRAELRTLREALERLTGGEVLVERFALRAQSTRMRTLAGNEAQPRVVQGIEGPTVDAASTEFMARPDIPTTPAPQAMRAVRGEPQRRNPAPADQPTTIARPVRPPAQTQPNPVGQTQTQRVVRVPAPQPPQRRVPPQPQQQGWPGAEPQQQVRRPRPVQPQSRRPASGDAGLSARLGGPVPAEPVPPQVRQSAAQTQRAERSRHLSGDKPVETTGGHRRVQDSGYRESGRTASGHRAKVDEPVWSDDPETTGSHATGRSVTELLAAHGQDDSPRRHRRRAD